MEDKQKRIKENLDKWIDFVNPQKLKDNMIVNSLYIANFEALNDYIVDQPKSFFETGFDENGTIVDPDYKEKVLDKDKKNPVTASLLWWKEQEAIDQTDIDTYHSVRKFRNQVTHEMLTFLFEGSDELPKHFADLMQLKIKLDRWWTINIEIPTNPDLDDLEEINPEEVVTSSEMLHYLISNILSEDEEKANFFMNAFTEHRDSMEQSNNSNKDSKEEKS